MIDLLIADSYVALSSNDKTGFRARELKSIHVDAIGCFVKFVIHKNHVNKHNAFNQVVWCYIMCSHCIYITIALHFQVLISYEQNLYSCINSRFSGEWRRANFDPIKLKILNKLQRMIHLHEKTPAELWCRSDHRLNSASGQMIEMQIIVTLIQRLVCKCFHP